MVAALGVIGLGLMTSTASAAGPEVVEGPGFEPACFAPWAEDTKHFQWPAKEGPYRIAVVNGFVANVWRIQMIQTAKAYAATPEIAKDLKEFKVVSVGTDMAAQLGAVEDYINQGFDAVLVNPNTPTGWDRVIRLANQKGTVLVAFDNEVESDQIAAVAQDNVAMGVLGGEWLVKHLGNKGKISRSAACRASPPTRTATRACAACWRRKATTSRSSKWSATGHLAIRRRPLPTLSQRMEIRRHLHAGRLKRDCAGLDGCKASLCAHGRGRREPVPHPDREACR
jgi:ABC-type sugar transport system substrate-binding protein